MLFWLVAILTVAACIWWYFAADSYDCSDLIAAIVSSIGIIAVVVSLIVFVFSHGCVEGDIAILNARRESLVYQYENDIYENDNDLGKHELMVEIQKWNEDLAMNRALQDNFWVGIYFPNIYDQFEFIELDRGGA